MSIRHVASFFALIASHAPAAGVTTKSRVVQNYNWLSKVVASRKDAIQFNAINLRDIDRGDGVSPSEYYLYTLQVTTGARRPRPYQLSVS